VRKEGYDEKKAEGRQLTPVGLNCEGLLFALEFGLHAVRQLHLTISCHQNIHSLDVIVDDFVGVQVRQALEALGDVLGQQTLRQVHKALLHQHCGPTLNHCHGEKKER